MKLSVITVNYNNFEGLKKTTESILCQSWKNFEWIIIDGGSNDGSKEYIEHIASRKESNVSFWCSEPDKGIFNAMNKGIVKAKGEYLNFMNSGDAFWDKNTLGKVDELISANKADVFYGDCVLDYGNRKETREHPSSLDIYELIVLPLCHQAMFFSNRVFRNGQYDEKYKISCDCVKNVELMLSGFCFKKLDMLVCVFDKHGISSASKDRNVEEFHKAIEDLVPKHIMSLVSKLYVYDQGHIYKRIKAVEEKGGAPALLLRLFLKVFG